ncbi:hemK methyltransferase family member 1 [Notechis scutatus]|uniref:HemK methyltransferase family member 1 n=1 Tax=Notechis scutatus TaxID=8663 RepID=A0A6J1UMH1_9SAUR|nr:hemK methyltransferase family member 1 [Notechis scutatus]
MTPFSSVFYRKVLCLFSYHGYFRMNRIEDTLLNPWHRLLRNSSYYKNNLVSAVDVVKYWQGVFEANNIPEAQTSSEYIVSHVLGSKTFQNLNASSISSPLSAKQQKEIQRLCAKRLQRKLALIVSLKGIKKELVSLILDEERRKRLTSACSKVLQDFPESRGPVILEVGCGSGAIGLSLLKKLPYSQLIAIDKLEAAVNLTKENAERLHLQERIHIFHHDITSCSWECLQPWGLVDTIISNPPYIFHEDMSDLAAEILCFEDLGALDGGIDGMSIIKEILAMASYILKDCGSVYLEVDPRHPKMVTNWLSSHPDLFLFVSATHKDIYGKPRFLHIQKRRKEDHQES